MQINKKPHINVIFPSFIWFDYPDFPGITCFFLFATHLTINIIDYKTRGSPHRTLMWYNLKL